VPLMHRTNNHVAHRHPYVGPIKVLGIVFFRRGRGFKIAGKCPPDVHYHRRHTLRFFSFFSFLGFNVGLYAQSLEVHWT